MTRSHFLLSLLLGAAMSPQVLSAQSLREELADDDRFTGFKAALEDSTVATGDVRTVFAPTDEAFRRLPMDLLERLGDPAGVEVLDAIVALHLVPSGPHESDDLPVEMTPLAADARIVVTYTTGALTLRVGQPDNALDAEGLLRARAGNEARVRIGDIPAGEALVHGIDAVLLPPDLDDLLARIDDPLATDRVTGETASSNDDDGIVDGNAPEDNFAAEVAEADDGMTDDVIPEEEPGAIVEEAKRDLTTTMVPIDPGTTSSMMPADDVAEAGRDDDLAGTVIVLEARDGGQTEAPAADASSPSTEAAPKAPTAPETKSADAGVDPEIDLARDLISVADLIGQPVSDDSGTELGEVTDVLVSLEGASAQTLIYSKEIGGLSLEAIGIGEPETVRVDMTEIAIDPLDGSVIVQTDDG